MAIGSKTRQILEKGENSTPRRDSARARPRPRPPESGEASTIRHDEETADREVDLIARRHDDGAKPVSKKTNSSSDSQPTYGYTFRVQFLSPLISGHAPRPGNMKADGNRISSEYHVSGTWYWSEGIMHNDSRTIQQPQAGCSPKQAGCSPIAQASHVRIGN